MADFFAALARHTDEVVETFRTGGGISWEHQGKDSREAQGAANRPLFLNHLGKTYLSAIPEVAERLKAGGRIAELGCGLGWGVIGAAQAFPEAAAVGYDIDLPSVEAARRNAIAHDVADRVEFHCVDGSAGLPAEGNAADGFDLVMALECVHDLGDPVGFLQTMGRLAGDDGVVIVMDERVADTFSGSADPLEATFYGFSLLCCLPDGKSHPQSAETGTVMRAPTLERYAKEAGFGGMEVLEDLEHDFFRFYRLHQ
jgi:SAM-dependent methyltransferase